jgi:hypothetical protein
MHCEQLHDFRGYLNVGFNFWEGVISIGYWVENWK